MVDAALLLIWLLAILLGGYFLVIAAFKLTPAENIIAGLAAGITIETVLASILGQVISAPVAFHLSAGLVLLTGLVLWGGDRNRQPLYPRTVIPTIISFVAIVALMYVICRGMGIFDDYAHLPTVSLVASGDIPPHFALNRSVPYAYHYFLILFAGQIARVGDLFVWSAMDLARSISFTLAVFLAGLWTARLTKNRFVGVLGGLFMALGAGTRWLLLLMSPSFLENVSKQITLIGSGASSGFTLAEALLTEWRIEGVGKLPIPFAFSNGIVQPGVLTIHGANGVMDIAIILLLLITFNRWRNWTSAVVTAVILSALSLVGEADLLFILAGWVIVLLLTFLRTRKFTFPKTFWIWGATIAGGIVISLFEGGAFLDILNNWLSPAEKTYQTVGFVLTWPPTFVSAHLGILSLIQPATLLVALFEVGPILLVIPLMAIWGYKAYRSNRWFEAALILGFLLTVGSILVNFEGSTGVRNTSRLYSFLVIAMIYFVPLLWRWASHRSDAWRYTGIGVFLISMVSGFILLASQFPSIQTPVVTPFMSELDARFSQKYWNKLDKEDMVFDPVPYRAVIVFGRAVEAGLTWYEYTPEWEALYANPDPVLIHLAGYDYIYVDEEYWNSTTIKVQENLRAACVKQMESEKMWPGIIRKLFDVSKCK